MEQNPRCTAVRSLVLATLLVWAGCTDPNLGEVEPIMGVGQQRLEFGAVAVGDGASKLVHIQNTGTGRLNLQASIEDDPAGAFLVNALDDSIDAGFAGTVEISFRPPDIARFEARLVLTGNDDLRPSATVDLGGDGYRRGAIQVEPLLVDFGNIKAGEIGLGSVAVRNVGTGDLIVTGIEMSPGTNPDFRIQSSTRTPATLPADSEVSLLLAYRPGLLSEPPGEGRLIIRAADPYQPETSVRLLASLNQAPRADAGPDQEVEPFSHVDLDGSASFDPDGDLPLTYSWLLVRKPEGSTAELDTLDESETGFAPDLVGVYEAELYVTDTTGLRSLMPDRVTITALPAEKLLVELVWNSPIADLDLHLLAPGGSLGGLLDCHWANPDPDWGQAGDAQDDPALLRDDLAGFGPETIGYAEPLNGTYSLVVDFFAAHTPSGNEPTTATLRIFIDGFLEAELTKQLDAQGQRWAAAEVLWPEGGVVAVDLLE
jgi:hypothetical protein